MSRALALSPPPTGHSGQPGRGQPQACAPSRLGASYFVLCRLQSQRYLAAWLGWAIIAQWRAGSWLAGWRAGGMAAVRSPSESERPCWVPPSKKRARDRNGEGRASFAGAYCCLVCPSGCCAVSGSQPFRPQPPPSLPGENPAKRNVGMAFHRLWLVLRQGHTDTHPLHLTAPSLDSRALPKHRNEKRETNSRPALFSCVECDQPPQPTGRLLRSGETPTRLGRLGRPWWPWLPGGWSRWPRPCVAVQALPLCVWTAPGQAGRRERSMGARNVAMTL